MKRPPEKPLMPKSEKERLEKLFGYNILNDYAKAGAFQHIASMAAQVFNVPVAFVNFVDGSSILVNSSVGVEGFSEINKDLGLCSLAIVREGVTVFENAKAEPSLSGHPMVEEFGLQFYAGAPIKTPDGFNIGVVAIVDKEPRAFSAEDEQSLADLAAAVMDELEEWKNKSGQS